MKRLMLLVCSVLMVTALATAQTKVIEKSTKKTPSWVGSAVDGYLIVTVESKTLAGAQKMVIPEITERIIQSIATNITVSSTNESSDINVNGDITSTDNYYKRVKINAVNLPFLNGISMGKAQGVYWEKHQNKKTKQVHYEYSVKYPFSEQERQKLIAEFKKVDAEKEARYKALEDNINELESVEDIKDAITQIETLEAYFFDEVRKTKAAGLKKRYKDLYNNISVSGVFVAPGKYQFQLLLGGYPVKYSMLPKIMSNCASQLSVVHSGDGKFIATYDAIDCLPEEENFLNFIFRIEGKKVEHKALLKEAGGAGASQYSVVPEGKMILTADSASAADRKVYDINIRMTVNNRSGKKFAVKSLELQVPEIVAPLVFDDINAIYSTAGIIQLKLRAEGCFSIRQVKKSAFSFIEGSITIVNPETGALERKRLSLPYITNWE